jgi:hypothetical protein
MLKMHNHTRDISYETNDFVQSTRSYFKRTSKANHLELIKGISPLATEVNESGLFLKMGDPMVKSIAKVDQIKKVEDRLSIKLLIAMKGSKSVIRGAIRDLGLLLDLMNDASNQAYSELAKLVKTL